MKIFVFLLILLVSTVANARRSFFIEPYVGLELLSWSSNQSQTNAGTTTNFELQGNYSGHQLVYKVTNSLEKSLLSVVILSTVFTQIIITKIQLMLQMMALKHHQLHLLLPQVDLSAFNLKDLELD